MKRNGKEDILKELKLKNKSSLFVVQFFSGQLYKFPIQFHSHHSRLQKMRFTLSPVFVSQFEQLLSGSEEITFYEESLDCMFKCRLLSFDRLQGDVQTTLPMSFTFEERRVENRIVVQQQMQMLYNEDHGHVLKKCVYDLSPGGFSLVFSATEQFRLKVGDTLKHVYISYGDKFQYFDSTVVNTLKLKPFELESLPYAFRRVSFSFDSLDEAQKVFLNYILEQESGLQRKKTS